MSFVKSSVGAELSRKGCKDWRPLEMVQTPHGDGQGLCSIKNDGWW